MPGVQMCNWAFFKNFKVTERANLQFRWENFNIFNVTNLSHFVTNGTDAGDAAWQALRYLGAHAKHAVGAAPEFLASSEVC